MKCLLLVLLCVAIAYCALEKRMAYTAEEICNAPTYAPGPQCLAFFRRYTYNKEKKQCEQFIWGGCFATLNNFATMEECKTCLLV
uniref:Kunitz type serine protease inhibitor 3 n=1 Tax=Ancylostoma duodenale TaxID=51022 RepID=X2BXA5_9BILA|nr:Kunitz type serine protease inhibitor 3 [Ancylostoma duodenale]